MPPVTELPVPEVVSTAEVRAWAIKKGFKVGQRGHLPQWVFDRFNKAHKRKIAINNNPSVVA